MQRVLKQLVIKSTWRETWNYNPPVLWSKGISQYCDFKGPKCYYRRQTESCQPESFFRRYYSGAHGLVWVRLSTQSRDGMPCDLDHFVRGALSTIQKPFTLITTDGDVSVPSEIPTATVKALLNCPWLMSWYTQNYDGYAHPKLVPFPIGIDLHTPRFCSSPLRLVLQLQRLRSHRIPLNQAPLRVFCDLELSYASEERRRITATLGHCSHVDFLKKRVSQGSIWKRYAEYPFVISTSGNGIDCHRTWELLYLGTIVITKTSSLDRLYDGLPVVIVKEWEEVCDHDNLGKWLQEYGTLTEEETVYRRLDPGNVLEPIRESLEKFRITSEN